MLRELGFYHLADVLVSVGVTLHELPKDSRNLVKLNIFWVVYPSQDINSIVWLQLKIIFYIVNDESFGKISTEP